MKHIQNPLKYFSQHFKTTEINYSFYRLPRPIVYQNWYSETPEGFLFYRFLLVSALFAVPFFLAIKKKPIPIKTLFPLPRIQIC